MKPSKIFLKYKGYTLKNLITEQEIIGLRKALNGFARTSLTKEERMKLIDLFVNDGVKIKITQQQSVKGLLWLKNLYMSPTGKVRKSNPFDAEQLEVIENFSHWTFEGLEDLSYEIGRYHQEYQYLFPIYRIHSTDGRFFEYTAHSWQTGLKVTFTEVQRKRIPLKMIRGGK